MVIEDDGPSPGRSPRHSASQRRCRGHLYPGIVHDVGKVTIPVEIFSRPGSGRVQIQLTWPDVSKQGAHGHARIPLKLARLLMTEAERDGGSHSDADVAEPSASARRTMAGVAASP